MEIRPRPGRGRYKAFALSAKPKGIASFQSADGIHWVPMTDHPVITDGAFDNQNVVFWNPNEKKYRAYWRHFIRGDNNTATANPIGIRAIRTATSDDFLNWGNQEDVCFVDSPEEALCNTPIKPYERAPHLLLGFPARYIERDSPSLALLPEPEHRAMRKSNKIRYGTALTEGLFMASRDGVMFKRWNEAFLRPGPERPEPGITAISSFHGYRWKRNPRFLGRRTSCRFTLLKAIGPAKAASCVVIRCGEMVSYRSEALMTGVSSSPRQ